MKKIKFALIFIVLFFATTQISFSQIDSSTHKNKSEIVKSSIYKLQQKILLANKQDTLIEQILTSFVKKNSVIKNKAIIFRRIEELLNNRQKEKFEIIKDDWWDHFIKQFNSN